MGDTPELVQPWLTSEHAGLVVDGTPLLSDITFTANRGELIALVGPNGAGKSTMLSLLSGDQHPTSGQTRIAGRPAAQWPPGELARVRAVMLQQQLMQFSYSVREIVELGRAPHRADHAQDKARVNQAMRDADVAHLANRDMTTLSGGEAARVVFARVLAQEAPIMLLDEPTAALDLHHQERLMRTVRERVDGQDLLSVVVLHDLNLASRYADRVLVFADGRLVIDGPPGVALTADLIGEVYRQRVHVLPHPDADVPLIVPAR